MTFQTYTPIDHSSWTEGSVATYNGATGYVVAAYEDEAGEVHLELSGPRFDHESNTVYPASECTPGGTPDIYAPTHELTPVDTQVYEVKNLTAPDGQIPSGWATIYKPEGVYVAWGLPRQDLAKMMAIGHRSGMRHFGSKM